MPSFNVTARKKGVITTTAIDAPTREEAIVAAVQTAEPGEEIEVMQAHEITGTGGVTGTTGTTGTTGPTGTW